MSESNFPIPIQISLELNLLSRRLEKIDSQYGLMQVLGEYFDKFVSTEKSLRRSSTSPKRMELSESAKRLQEIERAREEQDRMEFLQTFEQAKKPAIVEAVLTLASQEMQRRHLAENLRNGF